MYTGWIVPLGDKEEGEKLLTDLGVKLGPWNEELNEWYVCQADEDTIKKLDEYSFVRFVLGLQPIEL